MASTAQRSRRMVQISVRDAAGLPFFGARLDFFEHGRWLATLLDSAGKALIECPDDLALEVQVDVPGAQRSLHLSGDETKADFRLPIHRLSSVAPTPTAQCPDGTQGQPCVVCPIGASTIRICG